MLQMSSDKSKDKLDQVVARAHRERSAREDDYRARALKMYPWICGRCAREFSRENLRELTVHHRDHNHDNNPKDGSNWELLCVYCHDNEHSNLVDSHHAAGSAGSTRTQSTTYKPFENLADILKSKK
jgi:hypothetical protein